MGSENCKVVQNKKQLFTSRTRFRPFRKFSEDDVTTLSVSGFLEKEDILGITQMVDKELREGANLFVINFSKVKHLHYKDVDRLINLKEKIQDSDGEVKFVAKKAYLIDILLVGGWPFLLSLYPSEKSAIDALRKEHSLTWRKNGEYSYSRSTK